jgi:glycosyltransferase involved in cell wall biosynthesis
MRVGIYTHYAHCDQAYFCIRLVDFLRSRGVDFDIYADNQPGKLRIPYDSAVSYKSVMKFTDWAKKQSTIVWTHVPKLEQINYANRLGKNTILVPMWQELMPPFRKAMQRARIVVALCSEAQELFHDVYNVKTTALIPYDAGLPVTKKETPVNGRNIRIFMPWFDRNAKCSNSDFLGMLSYLFERMPDASLTVAITSSRFSPAIAKFFQTLGQKTGGRVTLLRNVPLAKRAALYADHDLTLYPAECDNYGLCSMTSINCGTPVLSFAVSPQTDFVYQDSNGVLVRTKIDYDENGVAHAIPDYEAYIDTLQTLIAEPWHIDNLNKRINYNLASRRKLFEHGWQTLLQIGE